ncbi:hypothetical protein ONS95_010619 [Cadophora gregata]|uniref:uncharacterized protein n=1 Tax=Cadophora gregata TaxID=51156 RepID=UPI0026DCB26B|nr:uncharacterized protein ONS95_010619 [Cadophora gregata]KAK0122379.1 hypothetical protein ONS95_010619 [Cadophora gregata]KAK0127857.1 hypothetical protein ONS96_007358 [Cadophora gregata f. sp. sojae]
MTPSPSPKMPKVDDDEKKMSVRRHSALAIHTAWTPTNHPDREIHSRSNASTSSAAGDSDECLAKDYLSHTGVSAVVRREPTPKGSDDEDAYKEEWEDTSLDDDEFEGDDEDSLVL